MTPTWRIEEDRPTRAVFVDGNDGTGKTTLVRSLREYLDKLERVFGDLGVELHDRGVATQATENNGPHSIRATDVYVILDASPETSQRRLAERGADLGEKYHTLESLAEYRVLFREIGEDIENWLKLAAGVSERVLMVNADESPRRVLLQVVRHLRKLAVIPSLALTLKALAAESCVLSLEQALMKERTERNANALALAQAVLRADRVELEQEAMQKLVLDLMLTMKKARDASDPNSEAALLLDEGLASVGASEAEETSDPTMDEIIALAQAVATSLPEHRATMRKINAELLWRRWQAIPSLPEEFDETKPPPGWEPSKDRPGWLRKTTFRSTEEVLSGPHCSSTHAVESHPPERAWAIYRSEHPPSYGGNRR